jgi:hypothetical protein
VNPDKQQPSGREKAPKAQDPARDKKTPNTDMQPEDAGTSESGADDSGTAAGGAMKQTSKTDAQSGRKR